MNAVVPRTDADGLPEFSVVITCLNEENSIREFHSRLVQTLDSVGREYEIVYVNDGSRDRTFAVLRELYEQHPRVRVVIDLFKNSGQGAAMTAGCTQALGQDFIFMDSDLQLDPEMLPQLINKFDEGCDYVTGYRENRRDSFFRIIPSAIANGIMRKVSKSSIRDFGCNAKVIRGRLIRGYGFGPHKVRAHREGHCPEGIPGGRYPLAGGGRSSQSSGSLRRNPAVWSISSRHFSSATDKEGTPFVPWRLLLPSRVCFPGLGLRSRRSGAPRAS